MGRTDAGWHPIAPGHLHAMRSAQPNSVRIIPQRRALMDITCVSTTSVRPLDTCGSAVLNPNTDKGLLQCQVHGPADVRAVGLIA